MAVKKYNRTGLRYKGTPTHNSWSAMKQRCYNKNSQFYYRYGGRGIKVCDRWLGPYGYQNFLSDMGEKPNGYSLDRIDNDKDYSPENCRWADKWAQAANRDWGKEDSKIPGVYRYNDHLWRASLGVDGHYYGLYAKTEKEAIEKRKMLEAKYLHQEK